MFHDMRGLIDMDLVYEHRSRGLTPDCPELRGSAQNPDTFFQSREACSPYFEESSRKSCWLVKLIYLLAYTEASTDTDLVLYDIVRGETLRFKHNNQLKASDFENHLIYLTELGPACDKITLRNQADEEDTGKDYLTDREVLFYKDEYIAQGTYVDHRQETNIRKSQ